MAPTTYTPPINTYVPLESIVLTNAASDITFFNIAQSDANGTYKDFVIVYEGTGSTATYPYLRINGDTGNNYYYVSMAGYSGGTFSGATNANRIILPYSEANQKATGMISLQDATASDKHKTSLIRQMGYDAGLSSWAMAGRWASTTAVSAITIGRDTGTWNSGAIFSIFGIHG